MEERKYDLEDLKLHKEKDKMVKEQRDKLKMLEEENKKLKEQNRTGVKIVRVSNNDEDKSLEDYMKEYEQSDRYKELCDADKTHRDIVDLLSSDLDEY